MPNPFVASFREAAFTLEETSFPEIADMLHIASREIERQEILLEKAQRPTAADMAQQVTAQVHPGQPGCTVRVRPTQGEETAMIEPTVGRIVHYRHQSRPIDANPQAAIITDFRPGDIYIDVCVFHKQHGATPVNGVLLWQGEGARPSGIPYCEWMPYQKGQAAKTEALEKQIGHGG